MQRSEERALKLRHRLRCHREQLFTADSSDRESRSPRKERIAASEPIGRAVKVAFDSRAAGEVSGVGRYSSSLLEALRTAGRGEVTESHDPRRCDVFHAPWLEGALLRCPVPMVVTLHDRVALRRRDPYPGPGLRLRLRCLAAQRATRVIVPTRAVADDTAAELQIPSERIVVISEAAAAAFRRRSDAEVSDVRKRLRLPDRYLLWVGDLRTPDPRKRVAALARTDRSMPLVLAGPIGRWARQLPGVTLTGAVNDEDLAAIYTGAQALVFPSDEEGFGLPPVEALACGTPVAVSDVPALREVLEGRAALTDVDDLQGLVRTAESLTRPAPAPPAWSWDEAAAATWDVYAEAVSELPRWRGARRGDRADKPVE
jgi:alpha-1,3-rhamnosyl/mannosyltransferase